MEEGSNLSEKDRNASGGASDTANIWKPSRMTHWGLRPVTCQGPQCPSQSLTTGTRTRSPLPADFERNDKCTHLLPRQLTHARTHFSLRFRSPVDSRCPLDIFYCQYQLFLGGGASE